MTAFSFIVFCIKIPVSKQCLPSSDAAFYGVSTGLLYLQMAQEIGIGSIKGQKKDKKSDLRLEGKTIIYHRTICARMLVSNDTSAHTTICSNKEK